MLKAPITEVLILAPSAITDAFIPAIPPPASTNALFTEPRLETIEAIA